MKKSKFSETQIIQLVKQGEAGSKVADLCREHQISPATSYKWKAKYGGMEVSEVKRMRELGEENRRLKQMYADLSLDHALLKEVLAKKF
jgi:putative transposase